MTEKQIKELAEVIHEDCMFDDPGQQYKVLKETENIIRTVAAEVRNETIDEMRDAAKKIAIAYCEIADVEVDIDATAARLKEQR